MNINAQVEAVPTRRVNVGRGMPHLLLLGEAGGPNLARKFAPDSPGPAPPALLYPWGPLTAPKPSA